jgi:hypothetical protein
VGEEVLERLMAGRLFRRVAIGQIVVHLCIYIASFVKLIIIEAGGYYNSEILLFVGITAISMPLFTISYWLVQHSLKLSNRRRLWGYCFDVAVSIWSISIVKVSYFR